MNQVWLDLVDKDLQRLRGAGNGQGAEPLSDKRAQAQAAGRYAARACTLSFNCTKGHRRKRQLFNSESQFALKGGGKIHFIAAIHKIADPVLGNWRAAIGHEQYSHEVIIPIWVLHTYCP